MAFKNAGRYYHGWIFSLVDPRINLANSMLRSILMSLSVHDVVTSVRRRPASGVAPHNTRSASEWNEVCNNRNFNTLSKSMRQGLPWAVYSYPASHGTQENCCSGSNYASVIRNFIVYSLFVKCVTDVKFRKSCSWKSLMRAMNLLCDDWATLTERK
jgi:hypothetical protein